MSVETSSLGAGLHQETPSICRMRKVGLAYNPWVDLERRVQSGALTFTWGDLKPARGLLRMGHDGGRTVWIHSGLTSLSVRETLSHELVHDERGILYTKETPLEQVAAEETVVRETTAMRLVPRHELRRALLAGMPNRYPPDLAWLAQRFVVPQRTVEHALELFVADGGRASAIAQATLGEWHISHPKGTTGFDDHGLFGRWWEPADPEPPIC